MSLSLPYSSQPRRSKTILSPEGTTAKFLYTIIKQLDLKSIDWNEVAAQLDITNGHAARMRYSRFKTQIEGLSKENKPKAKPIGKEPKVKHKGKEKRSYDDMHLEQSYSDRLFMEDDGDDKKKVKQDLADPSHLHAWNNVIKEEQDTQAPSTTDTNIKPDQGMQQTGVRNPADINTARSDLHGEHLDIAVTSAHAPQSRQPVKQETLHNPLPTTAAVGLRHAYIANASGTMLPRSQHRHYYPHYNGFRYGPQYRPYRLPHQNRAPHYGRYPGSHYQQLFHQPAYDPSAYELAAQSAYPWPYSEASIHPQAQQTHISVPAMHNDFGAATYNDVDLGQFSKDLEEWNGDTGKILESVSGFTSDSTTGEVAQLTSEEAAKSAECSQAKGATTCETHEASVVLLEEPSVQTDHTTKVDAAEQGKEDDRVTGKSEDVNTGVDSDKNDIIVKVEPEVFVL